MGLNLIFPMAFVTELPLVFAKLRDYIPAVVAVQNIGTAGTAVTKSRVRVSHKSHSEIPPSYILKS